MAGDGDDRREELAGRSRGILSLSRGVPPIDRAKYAITPRMKAK
jgi:hypothetical protein